MKTRTETMVERCGGCGATKGIREHGAPISVYRCSGCGGLVGRCYLGESYGLVSPRWAESVVPEEQTRYYDLTCLGSKGIERRHGWYDSATRRIVQVG
jgi:hypothetical protein